MRNPFNSLIGFSDILMENLSTVNGEDKQLVEVINRVSKSTYELLNDLLLWSKAEAGDLAFKPTEFNISLVLHEISNLIRSQAFQKEIQIENQLENKKLLMTADINMIGTVFRNLLQNAIKFTPKGGPYYNWTQNNQAK